MDQAGLTSGEAKERLLKFGRNELKESREWKAGKIFLSQFSSPLIYVLVLAGGITWLIGDTVDALVIGAAVVLNTFLGFYQEYKAERGLQALKKILTPKAKVIRDGKRAVIDASEIVPGDVCILEVGERVPADGVLIETDSLAASEAILTGESAAVAKNKDDQVFMGTTIAAGIGKMRATKTGLSTSLGTIAQSLKDTTEELTPLQRQLKKFSQKLTIILGLICLGIFGLGLARGIGLVEIFTTSVAIAVSAIPEGLVIALTVILALGMQRILKRKALVRRLVAAETLGGVTVIACDKTGTLTEGKMKVVKALTDDEALLRKAAVLCNDLRDPLEAAMMVWGKEEFKGEAKRLDEIPFDHQKKYIAALYPASAGQALLYVSGAPEVMLSKSRGVDVKAWTKKFAQEAKKGHRLVGFAYKKGHGSTVSHTDIKNLTWLGVLVYTDPIRPGVKEALSKAAEEGVKVLLITGDYKETAEAVGGQLGIKPENVFSRATPEQKLKIVEELQEQGEVVAMTGDGVNDAPALKKADIGIVVADAAAVAQETADMVLLDSNFATILAAVEEGRLIFANIVKVLYYLMAHAFAEVVVIGGSMVFNLPLPLSAVQILWINLINDSWPTFALVLDPGDGRRRAKRELFDCKTKLSVALISSLTGLMALALFYVYRSQSLAFSLIAIAPLIFSFSIGSLKNLYLVAAVAAGFLLQILVLYTPALQTVFDTRGLTFPEWLLVIGGSLLVVGVMEIMKRYGRR